MANPSAVLTLLESTAESGAGTSGVVQLDEGRTAALVYLRCTVGSVSVTLETSPDGTNGWRSVLQLAGGVLQAGTSSVTVERAVDDLDGYLRATWPDGTDATFEITAVGHQLLTRRSELYAKLAKSICDETEQQHPGIVARALIVATDVCVGPLGAFRDIDCMIRKFGIAGGPLGEVELTLDYYLVPRSITDAVASIAALIVLERHGFVGGGVDELVVAADKKARDWLVSVGDGNSAGAAAGGGSTQWRWSIPTERR